MRPCGVRLGANFRMGTVVTDWAAPDERAAILRDRRVQYETAGLDIADVDADPVVQWDRWHVDALQAGVTEPNAMTVATVGLDSHTHATQCRCRSKAILAGQEASNPGGPFRNCPKHQSAMAYRFIARNIDGAAPAPALLDSVGVGSRHRNVLLVRGYRDRPRHSMPFGYDPRIRNSEALSRSSASAGLNFSSSAWPSKSTKNT